MIALLSPAKTFSKQACVLDTHTHPELVNESANLMTYLRKMSEKDLCKLMRISSAISKLNIERYKKWKKTHTEQSAQPSIFAFKGDVYRALDIESLKNKDITFAQSHLRILSGLYGLLKPLDLIQEYRLEMGTRLPTKRGKTLYQFWGNQITQLLNSELNREKSPALINLASNEYWKAIHANQISAPIITPVFREKYGNTYKVIGIKAKRARGLMARYIIKNRIKTVSKIKQFNDGGYAYNAKLSNDQQWVFTHD